MVLVDTATPTQHQDWCKYVASMTQTPTGCTSAYLWFTSQTVVSLLGSGADNYTARQILLQSFESMVLRVEDVRKDITTFQKVLQYSRTTVNFVVMASVYKLPGDSIGKAQGHNNNILLVPASVGPDTQVNVKVKAPPMKSGRRIEKTAHRETIKEVPAQRTDHHPGVHKVPEVVHAERTTGAAENPSTRKHDAQCTRAKSEKHKDKNAVLITVKVEAILAYIWFK